MEVDCPSGLTPRGWSTGRGYFNGGARKEESGKIGNN